MEKRLGIDRRQTNALRLVDGAGDGLPGLFIDDFAGRWLAQTFSETKPSIEGDFGCYSLYWKALVKNAAAAPQHIAGEFVSKPFHILESGLLFEVDFQS